MLTVIRLFLRAVVWKGGPPMDVQRPNPITLAAVRAAKSGKVTNVTFDDL